MKRVPKKKPYIPRIRPAINTSSKTFVDGKTRSRTRRVLNRLDLSELF